MKPSSTLRLTLVVFVILSVGIEGLLRLPTVQHYLPAPALETGFQRLDAQFAALDSLRREKGDIECIFFGSSIVQFGIDVKIFTQAYEAQTGEAITCFNFGTWWLTASSMKPIAQILIKQYQPKLFVLGIAPHDVQLNPQTEGALAVEKKLPSTAWVAYRTGKFSVKGWLLDQSASYRYYYTLRDKLRQPEKYFTGIESQIVYGYQPALYHAVLPTPDIYTSPPSEQFVFDAEDVASLRDLIHIKTGNTRLLILEMPMQPSFIHYYFGNFTTYQQRFLEVIRSFADSAQVAFWTTHHLKLLLAGDYWADSMHLQIEGAILLSDWLGKQVAADQDSSENVSRHPYYERTLGLSEQHYQDYLMVKQNFRLIPSNAVIFSPDVTDKKLVRRLGFYIEHGTKFNEQAISQHEQLYELMVLVSRLRFADDINLTEWYHPQMIGIDYLFTRSRLSSYERVASWTVPSWADDFGTQTYYLYRVN